MITQTERGADVLPLTTIPGIAGYFGPEHVLADVAARHCEAHRTPFTRGVACGACWELAIRDDERFAIECDLPRELEADPDYIDEIAVDLACSGERVTLTPAELVVAVNRLRRRSVSLSRIALRLHVAYGAVVRIVRETSNEVAA
ncbi:hypothetical protein [Dactylosporangium sp. NPDC000521]|uniref:hypothetical protein n=1 Tax=Dactylosporangium sp. NPDC000521 TaxID=3363975 RepID=UPI0036BA973C